MYLKDFKSFVFLILRSSLIKIVSVSENELEVSRLLSSKDRVLFKLFSGDFDDWFIMGYIITCVLFVKEWVSLYFSYDLPYLKF